MFMNMNLLLNIWYKCVKFFSAFRTVLAIAGPDFAVIGSDTRLSEGFSIHTRDYPKTYTL